MKKEAKILIAKYINCLNDISALPEVKYNSKTNAAFKTYWPEMHSSSKKIILIRKQMAELPPTHIIQNGRGSQPIRPGEPLRQMS